MYNYITYVYIILHYIYKEIYYKELAHTFMEAEKSQDLVSKLVIRENNGIVPVQD